MTVPRPDQAHPSNAAGPWFVDTRCFRCDAARNWAPDLIGMDAAGRSVLTSQPLGTEQEAELWRAAAACPTKSIGNRDKGSVRKWGLLRFRLPPKTPKANGIRGTPLRGLQPALRAGLRPGHHQPPLRRVDRRLWLRAAHRRAAGPAHPPRPHSGDERRQLPSQGWPAGRWFPVSRLLKRRLAPTRTALPYPRSLPAAGHSP